jgi:hypothetical protein
LTTVPGDVRGHGGGQERHPLGGLGGAGERRSVIASVSRAVVRSGQMAVILVRLMCAPPR